VSPEEKIREAIALMERYGRGQMSACGDVVTLLKSALEELEEE
jgi:hypothetical protein